MTAILLWPRPVSSAASILTVYVATKNPASGAPIAVQAGITTDEPAGWAAKEYSLALRLRSPDGSPAAESAPAPGSQAVQSGQVTTELLRWILPPNLSGYYKLEVILIRNGATVATSSPWTIVIAKQTAAVQTCVHGATKSTANFGSLPSETTLFFLNGCIVKPGSSYSLTGGFASAPGGARPVIELDTPQARLIGGAVTPQFDPLSLSGVNGNGALFQQNRGSERSLQLTWLRQQGTPTGPSFAALQYSIHTANVAMRFGGGHSRALAEPDYGGLSTWGDGNFANFGFEWQPPPHRHTFGVRYGLVSYMDADGVTPRIDRALEAYANLSIGSTQWSLDELRTGPFYLAPGAPAVMPDRDAQTISGSFNIGAVAATVSAEGYHDDLPGANLSLRTNSWDENATFSLPVHDDVATLTFMGSSQQQSGDFASSFTTSGMMANYLLRRGPQSIQFTYGITGSDAGSDQQQTQVQGGIQISRAIAQGLSVTLGTAISGVRASSMDSASFNHTNFLTLSFSRDPWTFFSAISNSATQPGTGIAPPQTLSLNEGIELKLPGHLSLKLSMTKLNGPAPSSIGNLALGTQF